MPTIPDTIILDVSQLFYPLCVLMVVLLLTWFPPSRLVWVNSQMTLTKLLFLTITKAFQPMTIRKWEVLVKQPLTTTSQQPVLSQKMQYWWAQPTSRVLSTFGRDCYNGKKKCWCIWSWGSWYYYGVLCDSSCKLRKISRSMAVLLT